MKQETIEEAAYRLYPKNIDTNYSTHQEDTWDRNAQYRDEWINGVKFQKERSEQDFKDLWEFVNERCLNFLDDDAPKLGTFEEWFEHFKKK